MCSKSSTAERCTAAVSSNFCNGSNGDDEVSFDTVQTMPVSIQYPIRNEIMQRNVKGAMTRRKLCLPKKEHFGGFVSSFE
jgi:hypothetical protein